MAIATNEPVVLSRSKLNVKSSAITVLMLIAAFFPFFSGPYWLDVGFLTVFYIVLGLGLNVVVGYAGLLDLGYSAFFAVGAYTTGMLASQHFGVNMTFWLAIWIAAAVAAIFGL